MTIINEDHSNREDEALIRYDISPREYVNEFGHLKSWLVTEVQTKNHDFIAGVSGDYFLSYKGGVFSKGRRNLYDDCRLIQVYPLGADPFADPSLTH